VTAAWRDLQRLKFDVHAFVDETDPRPSGTVAAGGEGPSCDRLSGSHSEPALTRELPLVEVAESIRSRQADIFEQASELGRGIDAEPERDGAARSVGRGQYVLGFNLLAESGSG
jgi:hypothetical protein